MIKTLKTLHGKLALPTFFPDGTLGVVRGVDSLDLEQTQTEGIVVNAYHFLANFKMDKIVDIHKLMRWQGPVITDSGGFQVMSLVHRNPKMGKITDNEIIFKTESGEKVVLTPEKSIEVQLKLGTDIAICLDDCTEPGQSREIQEKSVERTIAWAKRCKDEFERLTKGQKEKPLLFAVVQGGNSKELRKKCAQALIELDFDGYCYGGFPVDKKGVFLTEILEYVAKLLPKDKPKYAMGIGKPENIVDSYKMGYEIFDCVIPTREARHRKLYIFDSKDISYSTIYIWSGKYANDEGPISKYCDCLTCREYSRGYLHHLFKIGDVLAVRLATIHNLRFYSELLGRLKHLS